MRRWSPDRGWEDPTAVGGSQSEIVKSTEPVKNGESILSLIIQTSNFPWESIEFRRETQHESISKIPRRTEFLK